MALKKEDVKDTAVKAEVKTEEVKAAPVEAAVQEEVKTEAPAPKKRGRKPGSKNASTLAKEAKKAGTKTTAEKKTPGRKKGSVGRPASAKKEELTPEIYLQYNGGEAVMSDVIERIKQQFMSEGHRAGNIKSLQIYMKPEENAVYYVINEKNAGKVNIF